MIKTDSVRFFVKYEIPEQMIARSIKPNVRSAYVNAKNSPIVMSLFMLRKDSSDIIGAFSISSKRSTFTAPRMKSNEKNKTHKIAVMMTVANNFAR